LIGPEDFAGRWRLERAIEDRLSAEAGRFDGIAVLRAAGPGLLDYAEEGELRLGGAPALAARRAYRWHFGAEGVEVRFPDGRPFHRFRPAGLAPGTDHLCGADLYRVTYDFGRWPDWSARWEVTGPRKDHVLLSAYRRD
jgi:hypothetical protein